MLISELDTWTFTENLASKDPVPGGGGVAALVGALGAALGSMVGSLTVGKKKYEIYENEILNAMAEMDSLRASLLHMIDGDAAAFIPLAKAYSIPKDDPARAETMEKALNTACSVPMEIMRTAAHAVELLRVFAEKGSVMALSDVGVGAACCKTAIQSASLNVFINTKAMADREKAMAIEAEADAIIDKYCALADTIYADVVARLRKKG